MPGTIQVSVLEFMGLPSSSPSSPISIKVSMGKREYQTRDKGDFSFPLTTLRETLIVTLQDDEGKEISHTGVGIMSIVERGVWDDIFPLEGGGHVHMKLQFTLSEDDRNRIRNMRESVLKKKKEEVFNSSIRSQESTRNDDSNAALSPLHNDEVSGVMSSQDSWNKSIRIEAGSSGIEKRSIHSEAVSGGEPDTEAGSQPNPNTYFEDSKSYPESKEGTSLYEQKNPNHADRSEVSSSTIPISQKVELQKELLGNSESSITPPFLQETSTTLGSSETFPATKNSSVSVKLEGESEVKPEKQGPLEKTPSSVRKMISAFESSLAQDTIPHVKGPTVKPQPNRVVMEGLVEDQNVKSEGDQEKLSSYKLKSPSITKPDESVGFDRDSDGTDSPKQTRHLKESSTVQIQSKETKSSESDKFKLLDEEDREERKQSQENLTLTSDIETATVSGRMFDEHSSRQQSCDSLSTLEERGCASMESGRKISSDSHEINSWEDSNDEPKPEAFCEVGDYSFENSGVWIFPDERKRFCITTGGQEVMNLMGGFHGEAKTHQIEKNVPITEKQDLHGGADVEIKKGDKTSPKLRKSTPESPEAVASTGPVGQAIKIAIMVGFGALVIFTRQRKFRKSNTEGKNPFLEIPEFIDELQPSEEWMDSRQTMMDRLKLW